LDGGQRPAGELQVPLLHHPLGIEDPAPRLEGPPPAADMEGACHDRTSRQTGVTAGVERRHHAKAAPRVQRLGRSFALCIVVVVQRRSVMLLAVLFYGVTALGGQTGTNPAPPSSNHQVIGPSADRADTTMLRFREMDDRRIIDELRRERVRLNYEAAVINQRWQLADELDRLIAANECGQ